LFYHSLRQTTSTKQFIGRNRFRASIAGDVIEIRGQPKEPILVDGRPVNEFSVQFKYNIATGEWVGLHGSGR
jgi:hypothetical protein